jgi:hypothetical protein
MQHDHPCSLKQSIAQEDTPAIQHSHIDALGLIFNPNNARHTTSVFLNMRPTIGLLQMLFARPSIAATAEYFSCLTIIFYRWTVHPPALWNIKPRG